MAGYEKFAMDRNKFNKNGIMDMYNPEGNSFEKENEEKKSRFEQNKEFFKEYASFWREYPDIFIDAITPPDSPFKLFFYQRIFLRVAMRYKYVYATFTRAFSKSFLSILSLFLKCIFYPGITVFVCSGGKEQSSKIASEKLSVIFKFLPLLRNEVKSIKESKDYLKLEFHNGSTFDIVAVENSSRGGRRNAGLTISPICQ